jgi:FAD/FMN-containing dehydrogenase
MMYSNNDKEWSNWSGDIRFTPKQVAVPESEAELQQLVKDACQQKYNLRAIGARHSCSAVFKTSDTIISLENFKELHAPDKTKLRATFGSGMTVEEIGDALFSQGLGMENTGHINKQAIAGAISTGTHGAGRHLTNISGQMTGVRMVNGLGEIKEYNEDEHPELMQALRVSLGALGIFTAVTLRVLPSFQLHRKQYCASTEDCLTHLPQLMEENRNFCFYWYPRRDDVSVRLWNEPDNGTQTLPFPAKLYKEYTGWGHEVLPTEHHLKYNELEYSLELDAAPACFREIRRRIKEKHRKIVGWRVLYRPIAGDSVFLSNAYQRDIVAITIHQNASLPYKEYFDDIEGIMQAHGGRPHWGKKHSLTAKELKVLYPMWNRFHELRQEFDPTGVFLNEHLKRLFVED